MLQLSSILTRKTPRKAKNKVKSLQNFNIRKKEERVYGKLNHTCIGNSNTTVQNSVDLDEAAINGPPHQDLHGFRFPIMELCVVYMIVFLQVLVPAECWVVYL